MSLCSSSYYYILLPDILRILGTNYFLTPKLDLALDVCRRYLRQALLFQNIAAAVNTRRHFPVWSSLQINGYISDFSKVRAAGPATAMLRY